VKKSWYNFVGQTDRETNTAQYGVLGMSPNDELTKLPLSV